MVVGSIIGLAMAVWGGKTGVTVSSDQESAKIYGWGAVVLGLMIVVSSVVALVIKH